MGFTTFSLCGTLFMKTISIFNNKGGVGKTTLTYHLAHILAEMGKKVLLMDLDSQSNLSLFSLSEEKLGEIWRAEDEIIDNGVESTKRKMKPYDFDKLLQKPRTIHFILKTVEEGISDFETLPPPVELTKNLDLIPGRLTLFAYENKISERWNGMFLGESLSIRTVTRIRQLAELYAEEKGYDFVIMDTSPSLGALNKVVISTVDGFIIPCLPDLFSLYGIKNIGEALTKWHREFTTCYKILSKEKRKAFPEKFVRLLGYTIYNAKKRSDMPKQWNLAQAHYNYAKQIPETIRDHITEDVRKHLSTKMLETPISDNAILHTHNTLPNMAQKYNQPMWQLPLCQLSYDKIINSAPYEETRARYEAFAEDFLKRVKTLDDE